MSAVLSPCGTYRYRLDRDVSRLLGGPVYAFFGVNPSTADAELDDPTVKKWRGFVTRWGGSRFVVGNIYAFRATDVGELAYTSNPVGPSNLEYIMEIAREADILVPCWGDRGKLPKALRHDVNVMRDLLRKFGKPVKVFGFTKDGDPLHPLILGYDTPLVEWPLGETGR